MITEDLTLPHLLQLHKNAQVLFIKSSIPIDTFKVIPYDLKQAWKAYIKAKDQLDAIVEYYEKKEC
jgi:hypothetical protein